MEEIFKKYPKLEVYFKTSDNNAFFSDSDAKNHAKGLEDKRVIPVYRPVKETHEDKPIDEIVPEKKEIPVDDSTKDNLTGKEEIPADESVEEIVPEKEKILPEESETKRTKTKK